MLSANLTNSVTKIFVISVKGFEPPTSCVRDQHAITVPARHMWETVSLNWPQFMLLWFRFRFPEFTEFSFHLWKTSLVYFVVPLIPLFWTSEEPALWFQTRVNPVTCMLHCLHIMDSIYLPTGLLAVSMTNWYL